MQGLRLYGVGYCSTTCLRAWCLEAGMFLWMRDLSFHTAVVSRIYFFCDTTLCRLAIGSWLFDGSKFLRNCVNIRPTYIFFLKIQAVFPAVEPFVFLWDIRYFSCLIPQKTWIHLCPYFTIQYNGFTSVHEWMIQMHYEGVKVKQSHYRPG